MKKYFLSLMLIVAMILPNRLKAADVRCLTESEWKSPLENLEYQVDALSENAPKHVTTVRQRSCRKMVFTRGEHSMVIFRKGQGLGAYMRPTAGSIGEPEVCQQKAEKLIRHWGSARLIRVLTMRRQSQATSGTT